jgi:hypothetical protein
MPCFDAREEYLRQKSLEESPQETINKLQERNRDLYARNDKLMRAICILSDIIDLRKVKDKETLDIIKKHREVDKERAKNTLYKRRK